MVDLPIATDYIGIPSGCDGIIVEHAVAITGLVERRFTRYGSVVLCYFRLEGEMMVQLRQIHPLQPWAGISPALHVSGLHMGSAETPHAGLVWMMGALFDSTVTPYQFVAIVKANAPKAVPAPVPAAG